MKTTINLTKSEAEALRGILGASGPAELLDSGLVGVYDKLNEKEELGLIRYEYGKFRLERLESRA